MLLAWALRRGPVATLAIEGPDRPRGERAAARRILDHYDVEDRHVVAMPDGVRRWVLGTQTRSYIPGRNLFFHAAGLLLARHLGARSVAAGHVRSDGETFADARRSFFDALERLDGVGQTSPVRIETPLLKMDKAGVVRLGRRLGAPLELSWSCYRDGRRPCGRCDACLEREKALKASSRAPVRPARPRPRASPARRVRAS